MAAVLSAEGGEKLLLGHPSYVNHVKPLDECNTLLDAVRVIKNVPKEVFFGLNSPFLDALASALCGINKDGSIIFSTSKDGVVESVEYPSDAVVDMVHRLVNLCQKESPAAVKFFLDRARGVHEPIVAIDAFCALINNKNPDHITTAAMMLDHPSATFIPAWLEGALVYAVRMNKIPFIQLLLPRVPIRSWPGRVRAVVQKYTWVSGSVELFNFLLENGVPLASLLPNAVLVTEPRFPFPMELTKHVLDQHGSKHPDVYPLLFEFAVGHGSKDAISYLLDQRSTYPLSDEVYAKAMFVVVPSADIAEFLLTKAGVPWKYREGSFAFLDKALKLEPTDLLEWFLKKGVSVHDGEMALVEALRRNLSLGYFTVLLRYGARLREFTDLRNIIGSNSPDLLLLFHHYDPGFVGTAAALREMLRSAVRNGAEDMVSMVVALGAECTTPGLLHRAVLNKHEFTLQTLLLKGADPNVVFEGKTAVQLAAASDSDVVKRVFRCFGIQV